MSRMAALHTCSLCCSSVCEGPHRFREGDLPLRCWRCVRLGLAEAGSLRATGVDVASARCGEVGQVAGSGGVAVGGDGDVTALGSGCIEGAARTVVVIGRGEMSGLNTYTTGGSGAPAVVAALLRVRVDMHMSVVPTERDVKGSYVSDASWARHKWPSWTFMTRASSAA